MDQRKMDEETGFLDRLDRWGADLGRWPERERNRATALLARSSDARALLRAASELEGDLAVAAPAPRTDRMRRSILAALPGSRPAEVSGLGAWAWLGWAGGMGAVAASLLVSFYLGAASPGVWPDSGETVADEELGVDSIILGLGFDGDSL